MQTLSNAESCVLVMNRPVAVCVKLVRKESRLHAGCVSPEARRLNKEQSIHSSVRWSCYSLKLHKLHKQRASVRQSGSDEHRSNSQSKEIHSNTQQHFLGAESEDGVRASSPTDPGPTETSASATFISAA